MKALVTPLTLCLCFAPFASAEPSNWYQSTQQWVSNTLDRLGADGQFDEDKPIDWSLMPGPFYTPEKEFGIGVSAIGLYRLSTNADSPQLSSVGIDGFASTNGAFGLSLHNANYFHNDQWRLFIDLEWTDTPDVFYGVGVDAGYNNQPVYYDRRTYLGAIYAQRLITRYTYLGFGLEASLNQSLTGENELMPHGRIADFPDDQRNIGGIVSIAYDSRDFALNASKGKEIKLEYRHFSQALGSDNDSQKLSYRYSEYVEPSVVDGVVAWQLRGQSNWGDVKWDQMANLGGSTALRGYQEGRYRDNHMMLGQVEYRQPLAGRHGLAYWVGVGTVAEELSELPNQNWLYSAGVGYRFEIKPKVNLRIDFGIGDGDSGFYFAINEAF